MISAAASSSWVRIAPRSAPGASAPDSWIDGSRSKRRSDGAAAVSEMVTSAPSGTSVWPSAARRKMLSMSDGSARSASSACRMTGYSRPRLTKVLTSFDASSACIVLAMVSAEMPRSSARWRSIRTSSCGWFSSKLISGFTSPSMPCARSSIALAQSFTLSKSGPLMTICTGVELPRRPSPAGVIGNPRATVTCPICGAMRRTTSAASMSRSSQGARRKTTKDRQGRLPKPVKVKTLATTPSARRGSRIASTCCAARSV